MKETEPKGPLEERVRDLALAEEALGKAVREALRMHKRAGNPIAVARDGHVVWIQPDEIPIDEDPTGQQSG